MIVIPLPYIIWWVYSKFYSIFIHLKDSGLSHRNTWGLRRVYLTVTKVLSAEDDPMLYPFLPYATVKDTPATISSCSASIDWDRSNSTIIINAKCITNRRRDENDNTTMKDQTVRGSSMLKITYGNAISICINDGISTVQCAMSWIRLLW